MDFIITDSALRKFLKTEADADTLAKDISLCGPTFDRLKKIEGDIVYEIEAITNRIDTASAMGVAREAAAILSQFNIPSKFINDPYKDKVKLQEGISKQFHFNIEKDLVIRFTAISIENVKIMASSKETQSLLENCGQRPVNNCVDITNELTLLYGLPSHIFDLDKLGAQSLTIRESKKGEEIVTLDNKKNQLAGGDIVIEDGSGRIVDLCGVMGGQAAEVDEHTKNILLIVPVYNSKKIRKTSLLVQSRTLAAQIYEKQPDPELCLPLLSKAANLFKERAGGDTSSPLFDFYPENYPSKLIKLDLDWLNRFIGITLEKDAVVSILDSLGFGGTIDGNNLTCSVPSWRYHDINIREDLAEEVARIYGYFGLPSTLPCVNIPVEPKNPILETENKIKYYLSDIGFHEVYNNSLVSLELLKNSSVDPSGVIKLNNPLSSDYEYLRTYLTPSGLENYKHNSGKIEGTIDVFEIANIYQLDEGKSLPREISTFSALTDGNYLSTKGTLESLLKKLRIKDITFKPTTEAPPFFNLTATADVFSENILLGQIGVIKSTILRNIGITTNPTAIELNLVNLTSQISKGYIYQPISEYPLVLEDITVASEKLLGDIMEKIRNSSTLIKKIKYLESFKDKHTFKVYFGSNERNLEQAEINSIKNIIQSRFKV